MDDMPEKRITVIVLRAVGVLIILLGFILTTHTIIQLMFISSFRSNIPGGMNLNVKGMIGSIQGWAIVGQLSISAWGFALYILAGWVSDFIVSGGKENTHL